MRTIKILICVILLFVIILHSYNFCKDYINKQKRQISFEKLSIALQKISNKYSNKIAYVIEDLRTGIRIEHNGDVLFPSASLVKIPIMASVLQSEEDGFISIYDKIRLKKEHKAAGAGILKRLSPNQSFAIHTLIELMITKSDNTATNMLTELLGLNYINNWLKKQGYEYTRLNRKIMDLEKRKKGIENFTTANEMADLLRSIYKRNLINERASEYMISVLKRQHVRDRIPRYLPSYVEVAHKTGLMNDVCHDVGIIFAEEGEILICILTQGLPTRLAKRIIAAISFETYYNL